MSAMRAQKIYDDYIKPLPATERVKLLALLADDVAQRADELAAGKHSIMELHGLGKDIWQEVDAQEYVNELRKEWEQRS